MSEASAYKPDPDAAYLARVAREVYKRRRERDKVFEEGLFGEPAWDILLDLFASEHEGKTVRVKSACIAAAVPPSTALRTIKHLYQAGLVLRVPDPQDRRAVYLRMSLQGAHVMQQALARVGVGGFDLGGLDAYHGA